MKHSSPRMPIGGHDLNLGNKKQCSRQLQCEVPCRSVMLSILPCPPCLLHGGGGGLVGERGLAGGLAGEGVGGRGRGRGQGTFHPPCHILHYHMVLCPEGTSHN